MYFRKKQLVDNQLKIDIRDLKKKGFKYGAELSGTVTMTSKGSFAFSIDENNLFLMYSYRDERNNLEPVRQEIKLNSSECHYGGMRAYFICSKCERKVMALYLSDKYFYCRSCCNLAYKSQQENKVDRLLRKARKIREKLNAENDMLGIIWHKPKGMHHKTFNRLSDESNTLMKKYFSGLLNTLRRK
jgi:hypothetical protein